MLSLIVWFLEHHFWIFLTIYILLQLGSSYCSSYGTLCLKHIGTMVVIPGSNHDCKQLDVKNIVTYAAADYDCIYSIHSNNIGITHPWIKLFIIFCQHFDVRCSMLDPELSTWSCSSPVQVLHPGRQVPARTCARRELGAGKQGSIRAARAPFLGAKKPVYGA